MQVIAKKREQVTQTTKQPTKWKGSILQMLNCFWVYRKLAKTWPQINNRVPVVQKMDNIIHWKIAMQWIIVDKTYCTIHWMVIYLFFWHLIVIPAGKKGLRWNRFWSSMIVWVITQCFQWNVALTNFPDSWTTTSL